MGSLGSSQEPVHSQAVPTSEASSAEATSAGKKDEEANLEVEAAEATLKLAPSQVSLAPDLSCPSSQQCVSAHLQLQLTSLLSSVALAVSRRCLHHWGLHGDHAWHRSHHRHQWHPVSLAASGHVDAWQQHTSSTLWPPGRADLFSGANQSR